jgi:hypothetical protein
MVHHVPFPGRELVTILSASDWRADLGSFVTNKGMSRYFNGKLTTGQRNKEDTKVTYSSVHRIGAICHLLRLQPRRDAPRNNLKIDLDVLCLRFEEQDQVVYVGRGMVCDALNTQMLQEQP